MGEENIKESKEVPEAAPEITPEMIQTAFKVLESQGLIHYMKGGAYVPTERGWKLLQEIERVKEVITGYGHPNITAEHKNTIEFTKDEDIKKDADCIVCVRADKACKELSEKFKLALKDAKRVEITIEADGMSDKLTAYGSPALTPTSDKDVVIRKSDYIDQRTLAILADKAACDLDRLLVEKLKNPDTRVKITLEIKP